MRPWVFLAILIGTLFIGQGRSEIPGGQREILGKLLKDPGLMAELKRYFYYRGVLGSDKAEARVAFTVKFFRQRGIDPAIIEIDRGSLSVPYLKVRDFFAPGSDLLILPTNFLTGKGPDAGSLEQLAEGASITNKSSVQFENQRLRELLEREKPLLVRAADSTGEPPPTPDFKQRCAKVISRMFRASLPATN